MKIYGMAKAGEIKLHYHDIRVDDIAHHAIKPFEKQFSDKQILIKLNLPKWPLSINADAEKITWVLINFIGNALRYSQRWGTISISIQDKENEVKFSVEDNGEGIPQNRLEKIFVASIHSNQSPQNGGGFGLALSISREIIEAHGGKIYAESKLGEGSNFSFILPKK